MTSNVNPAVRQAIEVLTHQLLGDRALGDSLRPYTGSIDKTQLASILDAANTLATEAKAGSDIPMGAISGLHQIIKMVRITAVDPGSMLVRNKRISDADHDALARWVGELDDALSLLLGTLEDRET